MSLLLAKLGPNNCLTAELSCSNGVYERSDNHFSFRAESVGAGLGLAERTGQATHIANRLAVVDQGLKHGQISTRIAQQ